MGKADTARRKAAGMCAWCGIRPAIREGAKCLDCTAAVHSGRGGKRSGWPRPKPRNTIRTAVSCAGCGADCGNGAACPFCDTEAQHA